jgi:hypothetical protein
MDLATPAGLLAAVAREVGSTEEQMWALRNVAASLQMEGMPLTLEELRVGAEVAAGRFDVTTARQRLGV